MKSSKIMNRLFAAGIGALLVSVSFAQSGKDEPTDKAIPSLAEARKAFQNYEPEQANALLEKIMANPETEAPTKVMASLYISRLATKVFGDFDKAKKALDKAIELDPKKHLSYLTYSQMASFAGRHDLALSNAEIAVKNAATKEEKIAAYSSLGEVLLRRDLKKIQDGTDSRWFTSLAPENELRGKVISGLERVLMEDPGKRDLLKTKFALEVLSGRGGQAIATWRDYFVFNEDSNQLLQTTYSKLRPVLSSVDGGELSIDKKRSLALALADAKDFDLANAVIKTLPATMVEQEGRLKEIVNYCQFLDKLRMAKEEFYRNTAVGKPDPNGFRNQLISYVRTLWDSFDWEAEPKEFTLDNVEIEIDRRFGAAIRIGRANGWFSITWGHKVIEYGGEIEQYGKRADMVFRSIDYLSSNGFIGWYFEDDKIGGWQDGNTVYQVRTSYLSRPYQAWFSISGPDALKAWENRITAGTREDVAIAAAKTTSIFPGMAAEIELRSLQELLNELKRKGFEGDALRNRFISEYERLTFENEILSHEGRHLIDSALKNETGEKFASDELEFRAKLSEIAFAKYPFMALAAMFKGGIGNTPHGKANERLARSIYDWLEKNWKEVEGIDESLPKGPQANKLSNDQLVAIVRSLDPLFRNSAPGK